MRKMQVNSLAELVSRLGFHGKCAIRPAQFVANLGWDRVKVTRPVFASDTLYAESTVLSKRESKSRPTQGIVTVFTRGINQDGVGVMSFERTMLMYKRGHSQLTLLL